MQTTFHSFSGPLNTQYTSTFNNHFDIYTHQLAWIHSEVSCSASITPCTNITAIPCRAVWPPGGLWAGFRWSAGPHSWSPKPPFWCSYEKNGTKPNCYSAEPRAMWEQLGISQSVPSRGTWWLTITLQWEEKYKHDAPNLVRPGKAMEVVSSGEEICYVTLDTIWAIFFLEKIVVFLYQNC